MLHPRATLDGSTRLRAERPAAPRREPVSPRRPASRMFSISIYAFSQTGLRKSGPFGAVEIEAAVPVVSTPWRMG